MKRLRIILLFLLLGAIVNVAVAWGSAFIRLGSGESLGPGLTSETGACWRLRKYEYFGYTYLAGVAILEGERMDVHRMQDISFIDMHVPAWSHFADPSRVRITMVEESRGWPFRTLLWFQTFSMGSTTVTTNDVRKHVWLVGESPNEIKLPLAPIWSGVLLNTFFYASLFWLLISGLLALRRMIRRKRGLCVTCAYDLRGAEHEACPECGLAVPLQ